MTKDKGKTIKETFLELCEEYRDLSEYLDSLDPSVLEGALVKDEYRETSDSLRIISGYFRERAERITEDCPLSERTQTPGYGAIQNFKKLPSALREQVEEDLSIWEDSGIVFDSGGYASIAIREIAKVIKERRIQEDPSLFPGTPSLGTKEDILLSAKSEVLDLFLAIRRLALMIDNTEETESRMTEIISSVTELLKGFTGELSLEEAKEKYREVLELRRGVAKLLNEGEGEIDGKEGALVATATALEAIEELSRNNTTSPLALTKIPKDLLEAQISTPEDTLVLIRKNEKLSEEKKKEVIGKIESLQKEGKLLHGSMKGLSGGSAYFKVFTIALAQTLNEQMKFYDSEVGLPPEFVEKYVGPGVRVETEKDLPLLKRGEKVSTEKRSYPYILLVYSEIAKKTTGKEDSWGGNNIDFVRKYTKELQEKEYLLADGKGGLIGIPYIHKEATFYLEKTGTEVAVLVRLSPQFSKSVRGYSGLRSDTIQLLGGGHQSNMTMNLLNFLVYVRGVPQKGRPKGEFAIRKDRLMEQIATGKTEKKRPRIRESNFKEALQKVTDAKILRSRRGYREEVLPGGVVMSVFTFNPDYLKGEERELGTEVR